MRGLLLPYICPLNMITNKKLSGTDAQLRQSGIGRGVFLFWRIKSGESNLRDHTSSCMVDTAQFASISVWAVSRSPERRASIIRLWLA